MRYAFVSSGKVPDWVSFWGVASSDVNAAARALVFIPVKSRIFVLSYGFGYVHLNFDYVERDFGLETVKRVVESSSIKSASTYNLSLAKKQQTQFVVLNRNLEKIEEANKVYISNQGATLWQKKINLKNRNVAA